LGKPKHWSDYWAGGCLTSLPQDFPANYDGEIARYWNGQFEQAPDHGKLLDLCTGNGAIVLLAAAYAQSTSRPFELYAVDAARINPQSIAARYPEQSHLLSSVHLISDCRVEDIDLEPASFDLVTSQYGVEYCDWSQAADQVFRLLKPGGRFALLSHAVSTDIVKYMETEKQEYELLERLKFLSGIDRFLQGKLNFPQFQKTLRKTQRVLSREYQGSPTPLLATILKMLANVLPMNEPTLRQNWSRLDQFRNRIIHGRDRLKDMLRVNRAIQSDPEWYRVFENRGLELVDSGNILYRGEHHSGCYYCFVKPG
jgi:SAM-dependent methyltransferase